MPDNVLIANDITVELGSAYVGSAYSPQASVEQTETGWELTITYADPDTPGELATLTIPVDSAGFGEVTASVTEGHGTPQVTVTESGPDTAKEFHFAFSGIGGFSPTITVTEIEGGHRVTVTDVDGTQSFDVLDGDPSQAIEDAERAAALANAAAATADASAAEADTATTAAQTATTAAQGAASAAQTATSAANTATGRANTAATSATSAASAAQTATTAAQSATTAADTAADNAQDAADRANAAAAGITDAYSPMLTAGAAEGITGGGPTDTASWMYRTCPGTDGPAKVESIHGRTVVWNQMHDTSGFVANVSRVVTGHIYYLSAIPASDASIPSGGFLRLRLYTRSEGTNRALISLILYDTAKGAVLFTSAYDAVSNGSGSAVEGNLWEYIDRSGGATGNLESIQLIDLTRMFGAGNEPSTVAEFESLFPDAYYPYDAGSLQPVRMEGVESVGFNQWDEQWEKGSISSTTGQTTLSNDTIRSTNYIPVFPGTAYASSGQQLVCLFYDADKTYIGGLSMTSANGYTLTTPTNCRYMRFRTPTSYGTTYKHDICINLSGPRNGEYEPHWQQVRTIPASTYFPNGMRSAGSVYDELTATSAITRIGERAYQSGDESDANVVTDGTVTHYALATPTTTIIDPPLNLTYKAAQGGTERVTHTDPTAPPTLAITYGSTPAGIVASALAAIADPDGPTAQATHAVGTYLTMGGTLYRVTTAIAIGESIVPGTNVVATTVMAEVLSLVQ